MNMRFDGYIGFPGGVVEKGESICEGLKRELKEEIGLDIAECETSELQHMMSHVVHRTKLCLHFYVMKVSVKRLIEIERNMLTASEYGSEVKQSA